MTTTDLIHRKVRFEPELDLESVAELPGKDIMQDTERRLGGSGFIQDSHGWCFYVCADDGRKYPLELLYAATERDASRWVLMCSRCAGLRAWEWFGSQTPHLGREQQVLDRATEVFNGVHDGHGKWRARGARAVRRAPVRRPALRGSPQGS